MGNGESTSRRIALQRSDEGTIQISEDVMYRLKGESNEQTQVSLKDGETVVHEDDLKYMVEDAFLQGRKHEHDRLMDEKEFSNKDVHEQQEKFEQAKRDLETKLEEAEKRYENVAAGMVSGDKIYRENMEKKIRDEMNEKLYTEEERHKEEVNLLKQQIEQLNDNGGTENLSQKLIELQQEKNSLDNKLTLREKEIQEEFSKSVADIQERIKPLESSTICTESQSKVLDCYRLHKKQPLKCAKEVKDFVDCVQSARLKFMERHLVGKP